MDEARDVNRVFPDGLVTNFESDLGETDTWS